MRFTVVIFLLINGGFVSFLTEAALDGWGTDISQIALRSEGQPDKWDCSISEISTLDTVSMKSDWSCSIAEGLRKEDRPEDWNTSFKKPEPLTNDRAQWKTMIAKVKERVLDKNEWKFTFRKIGNRKRGGSGGANEDNWNFKLTDSFQNRNDKVKDWRNKINDPGSVTLASDEWRLSERKVDVRSDDRLTHWKTKFTKIQEKNEDPSVWQTQFRKIEPIPENRTWSTEITQISDDLGSEEDWNIKFIDIEKNGDRPEDWAISMNDVPDSTRSPADWGTEFKPLEEHLKNPNESWGFAFNDIEENNAIDRLLWQNQFKTLDRGEDESWTMQFNRVEDIGERDTDWFIKVNPIELAEDG